MPIHPFQALRNRDYRFLLLAHVGTGITLWMDIVVRSWLVWQLTTDPFLLGLVNLLQAIPFLIFAFPAGMVADRFDKKRVLMVSQASTLVLHAALATLIASGTAQLWQVFLTAFLAGVAQAFIQPARMSLIPTLVKGGDIINATGLSGAANNSTRIIGPSIAGTMVGLVGSAAVYYVMAAVFILVILATAMMRVPRTEARSAAPAVGENLREGFRYIRQDRIVLTLLLVTIIPMVFGMPYITLLPVFADNVFGIGASGLGLLTSAPGIGSVVGAGAVASAGNFRRKGLILIFGAFAFGVFLVIFSLSRWLPLSLVSLMLVGMSATAYNTLSTALLLTIPPREFRGRVMSIFMMDRGLVPLGSVMLGAAAAQWSAPLAIGMTGGICALLALAVTLYVPSVRRLQ